MGMNNIHTLMYGKTILQAFNRAVDSALHYYGHDAYNGSISTCDNLITRLKDTPPRYGTKAFERFEEKALAALSKRDVIAIKLHPAAAKRWKANTGNKGKHGNVYVFIGWAAC